MADYASDSGLGSMMTISSGKPKQWLHFHPLDFLNKGKRHDMDNFGHSSSPELKSGGDTQIEKADKVFTVAAKDRSMLERLAHKAQDRVLRIRQPHEVRGRGSDIFDPEVMIGNGYNIVVTM